MLDIVRKGLAAKLDAKLVDELLEAHAEAKRNYYLGGLRLSAVEGGRFCEAAFRLLQQITTGAFDPIGTPLDTDRIIRTLGQLPVGSHPDSIRLHIPRALRVVYDIRNKRDAAHLADGIDPNLQDAMLVTSVIDWALAEFVRLYHAVSANQAQVIVETIVTRRAPAIEDFAGHLKVLRTDLGASDFVLLLLYQRGAQAATFTELETWVRPAMRQNLRRTLRGLVDSKAFVHSADEKLFQITQSGRQYVEENKLMDGH